MKEIVVVTYHILFLSALLSKNDLTEQYSFLHNLGKNVSFRCGCIATCFGKNIFKAGFRPDRANPRADRVDMKPERIDEN